MISLLVSGQGTDIDCAVLSRPLRLNHSVSAQEQPGALNTAEHTTRSEEPWRNHVARIDVKRAVGGLPPNAYRHSTGKIHAVIIVNFRELT